jgi:hypothetical protein
MGVQVKPKLGQRLRLSLLDNRLKRLISVFEKSRIFPDIIGFS